MGKITDELNKAKKWWQSKTIIGTILMILPTIIKIIKPDLVMDLSGAVNEAWTILDTVANTGDQIWATVMEVAGTVLALYGRLVAKVGIKKSIV